ncbi:hypothetical protein M9458_029676, partial [Cirrhinus mrigala]
EDEEQVLLVAPYHPQGMGTIWHLRPDLWNLHVTQAYALNFRHSEQLFVCFGGHQKGNAVSKQRLAHWVVDAITLAYQCQGEPCTLRVRAHSTRNIFRAAGWATPNTFARIYNLRIEPVSFRVL